MAREIRFSEDILELDIEETKLGPDTREVGTETDDRRHSSRRLTLCSSNSPINKRSRKFNRVMSLVKWKRSQSRDTSSMNIRTEFSTRILKPNDYFFFSVFTSLFCFLPIGLIGIYFSIKSVISFHAYKFSDAIYYSKLSFKFNIIAFSIGFIFFVLSMLVYFYLMCGFVFNDI